MLKNKYTQQISNINNNVFHVGCSLFIIISFYFYLQQYLINGFPFYDARGYIELGQKIEKSGIDLYNNNLRTFAYPWLISLIFKLSNFVNLPLNFLIFLIQALFYYLAVLYTTITFLKVSNKLANFVYLALCTNIFLLPYISIPLTDSIYLTFSLLIFTSILRINNCLTESIGIKKIDIFILIFCLCFNIVVRPAALWLVLPVTFFIFILIKNKSIQIPELILMVLIGSIPLLIQTSINVTHHKIVSFLPTYDLGTMQIKWGIENFKYSTWVGGGLPSNYYPTNVLIDLKNVDFTIWWYFNNFSDAAQLLIFKLVAAFDFDYLMPYANVKPTFRWLPSFFSYSILWVGFCGTIYHLITDKLTFIGNRFLPIIIFLSWCSLTLITALELRFTLPLLTYLLIIGIYFLTYLNQIANFKLLKIILFGWILILPVFYLIAKFIRQQSIYY